MAIRLAAVVQMTSTADVEANWEQARGLIARAAAAGAQLVATPENTLYLGPPESKVSLAEPLDGPQCRRFSALARELGIELLLGSFAERAAVSGKCHNTSVLFGRDGAIRAVYRKIHLFDVDVPGGASYRESAHVAAGAEAVVADSALGRLGMSICYDLRFGNLYRALVERGAEVLAIPAAFTMTTGRAHWEVLVRARAIECQAHVLAPAQSGRHDDPGLRESFGHAMIVDPWGQVLAMAADGPGVALAELELGRVESTRRAIPVGSHWRHGLG
jgi:predicted amidohydrolase